MPRRRPPVDRVLRAAIRRLNAQTQRTEDAREDVERLLADRGVAAPSTRKIDPDVRRARCRRMCGALDVRIAVMDVRLLREVHRRLLELETLIGADAQTGKDSNMYLKGEAAREAWMCGSPAWGRGS